MELLECLEKRSSVRSFTDEPVSQDLIIESIRIGNLAPSAGNLQARDFIIVTDQKTKGQLAQAAHGQQFLEQAPVVIVCCANMKRIGGYGQRGKELFCLQDVAASVENMLLFFVDKGYGSCWVGAFDETAVSRILSIPSFSRPVAMLPVGRPQFSGGGKARMRLDELLHRERW